MGRPKGSKNKPAATPLKTFPLCKEIFSLQKEGKIPKENLALIETIKTEEQELFDFEAEYFSPRAFKLALDRYKGMDAKKREHLNQLLWDVHNAFANWHMWMGSLHADEHEEFEETVNNARARVLVHLHAIEPAPAGKKPLIH